MLNSKLWCFLVDVNNGFRDIDAGYVSVFIGYYIKPLKLNLDRATKALKNDRTQNIGDPTWKIKSIADIKYIFNHKNRV